MSTWTYLYRRDNGRIWAVLDLHEWREQSRITHGFAESKVKVFCSRNATPEEEKEYAEFTRMYYCLYEQIETLLTDEKRIAGNEFAERLKDMWNKHLSST